MDEPNLIKNANAEAISPLSNYVLMHLETHIESFDLKTQKHNKLRLTDLMDTQLSPDGQHLAQVKENYITVLNVLRIAVKKTSLCNHNQMLYPNFIYSRWQAIISSRSLSFAVKNADES